MATASSPPKPVLVEEPGPRSDRVLDGRGLKIALISTHWYDKEVVHSLAQACKDELLHKGVASADITHLKVPGVFELPFAASRVIHAKKRHVDAVICIGCMVKGATMAYEFVSEATTMGLMKLNVQTDTPVVCGILACQGMEEAKQATVPTHACVTSGSGSTAKPCNCGVEWAQETLEMARLKRSTEEMIQAKCRCTCHCKQQGCSCVCHCKQCKCRADCENKQCECSSCSTHQETEKTTQAVAHFKQAMEGWIDAAKKSCGGCNKESCKECSSSKGKPSKSESSETHGGYHGRSSAPLKGEPNTETLP